MHGPADSHRLVELPEGYSLGWEGAVATASKVLAMGGVIPAEGKASLEVVCEQSLEWVISWWKWPHPLWVLLALLPDSLCCGHTSLPDVLGVKTSSLSFCQGNAFPRDVLGQGSWEAQCIQALSGRMEPQEWLRGILCSGGSGYFPVGVTV